MPNADDHSDDELLEPEAAFRRFAHELRIAILFELWRASDRSLTFSELQERVGERDSGKFNYHLSKLVGQFVGHDDDRYRLLYPGHRVIDAIRSGVLHRRTAIGPVALDEGCPYCGSSLAFTYADHVGAVSCSACGAEVVEYPFDPGGLADRSPREVAVAFDIRTRNVWRFALSGVCPVCAGPVGATLETGLKNRSDLPRAVEDHPAVVDVDCDRCSFFSHLPVGGVLLGHPAVLGLLYDRGVDVRDHRLWELDFVADPSRVTVRSSAPPEVALCARVGDETLRAVVDDALSVPSLERSLAERE